MSAWRYDACVGMSAASEMFAVMKQKSADYRAQPGSRYTGTQQAADEAQAKIASSSETHWKSLREK